MTAAAILGAVDFERTDFLRHQFDRHRPAASRDAGIQSERPHPKPVRAVERDDVQPNPLADPDLDALRREGVTRYRHVDGSGRMEPLQSTSTTTSGSASSSVGPNRFILLSFPLVLR